MFQQLIKSTKHQLGKFIRYFRIFYLRNAGVQIGSNCMLSLGAKIDIRRGKIVIGNNCTITYGCIILSHDRSKTHIHPECKGEYTTRLNNNCYLGVGSIILPGVTIGENSVIGAGAVVTKDIPSSVVAVGNPAKIIRHI